MRKPFDLEFYKSHPDCKVETRGGRPVRIICTDAKGLCPIVYLSPEIGFGGNTIETPHHCNSEGRYCNRAGSQDEDLFLVTDEPEELTEFQQNLKSICDACIKAPGVDTIEVAIMESKKLLSLAREQLIKDGYVIEKKAFHDAVENISDKHIAEMSVQYSLHCKVENGTRHAVMNWEAFQKLAQKFIDIGKEEALKDLPRWKKHECGLLPKKFYMQFYDSVLKGNDGIILYNGYEISLQSITKLPGFKEE